MRKHELRADEVVDAPDSPGLYAWYYRPIAPSRSSLVNTLSRLLSSTPAISTKVTQRYGLRYVSEGTTSVVLGSEERTVRESIIEAMDTAPHYFEDLLQSEQFQSFCRPIYIGIAKSLRERVYAQHYVSLIEYWDHEHRITKFLNAHPQADIQFVMEQLDLTHSFALEARVLGIAPRDLAVSLYQTPELPSTIGSDSDGKSDSSTRRALERMLQLLTDPVCGRR